MDYDTSYCFLISTTNDSIPVRNDMSPSPHPSPHVGGRVYKSPLLEIKDFGPPASGGLLVVLEYKLKNIACIFEKFVVLSSSKEISWG